MSDRKIEITLTQQVDDASITRSQHTVKQAAKSTAESITATEQEESQKRIAIAEEEAAAKAQVMQSVAPASSTVSSSDARGGTERLIQGLEQLQELMGEHQNTTRSWVEEMDNARAALEAAAESAGVSKDILADYDVGIEDLASHQIELHQRMQEVAEGAQALATGVATGKVSMSDAAKAAATLQQRNIAVAAGMKEMRRDAVRLKADMTEAMQGMQQEASVTKTSVESVGDAAMATGNKVAAMGKAATTATGGMIKGFKAVAKAVTMVTRVIGRVSFALMVVQMAWDGLTKLWDWLQGKNEAATKAAEEHAEAVEKLKEEEEDLFLRQMEAHRQLESSKVYEHLERGIRSVNKALTEELELLEATLELDLKRKNMEWDKEEWELDEQERDLRTREQGGDLTEGDADNMRAEIARQREELRHRRDMAALDNRSQLLEAKTKELASGIATVQHELDRIAPLLDAIDPNEDYTRRIVGMEENALRRKRYFAGEMGKVEEEDYLLYESNMKTLLTAAGRSSQYDAYIRGEINLREELESKQKEYKEKLDELNKATQATTLAMQSHAIDIERSTAEHQHNKRTLEQEEEAETYERLKKSLEKEAEEVEKSAEDAARLAQTRRRELLERNKQLIAQRAKLRKEQQRTSEAPVSNLYDVLAGNGDGDMLRRVIAELQKKGNQGQLKRKDVDTYGATSLKGVLGLTGKDREWWGERFSSLQQSQKLEQQAAALDAAADKLGTAADIAAENIGNVSEQAGRIAEAYERQVQLTQQLTQKLEETLTRLSTLERQVKHSRKN